MVLAVIVLDGLIAGFCFYLAWRLWKWRLALSRLVIALDLWTLRIQAAMNAEHAAQSVISTHRMTASLHRRYTCLDSQLRLMREILKGLGLIPVAFRHGQSLIQFLARRKHQRSPLKLRQ